MSAAAIVANVDEAAFWPRASAGVETGADLASGGRKAVAK